MLTKNVYFGERPEAVIVNRYGSSYNCRVDLPVNIEEVETGEGETQWKADVYSIECGYTVGLKERVEADYESWLAVAHEVIAPQPTIQDAIDAINELTDIILGGE